MVLPSGRVRASTWGHTSSLGQGSWARLKANSSSAEVTEASMAPGRRACRSDISREPLPVEQITSSARPRGLGLVHQLEAVGERLHLAQGIRLHQLQMQVATAQFPGDAAPHLAIAEQGGLADIEGTPQGTCEGLRGVDHAQADLDIFRLLEGLRATEMTGPPGTPVVALMAVLGHLHHPDEAGAKVLGQYRLALGEVAADVGMMSRSWDITRGAIWAITLTGIRGPVAIEGQHGVVLLGPGQGRPVHGLGFGQDGTDPAHPIEHLDEVGSVGKQVGHQQDAEIPKTSLFGEMAKNRCSDP